MAVIYSPSRRSSRNLEKRLVMSGHGEDHMMGLEGAKRKLDADLEGLGNDKKKARVDDEIEDVSMVDISVSSAE